MDEITCTATALRAAKKPFSRIGLAFCAMFLVTTLLQGLLIYVPAILWGEDNWLAASSWGKWIVSFVPLYLVGMPVCVLVMKKLPAQPPQDTPLTKQAYGTLIPILFCITYAGNLLGNFLSLILSGGTAENALNEYAMDTNPIKILVMVILAPLLEEYICRKQIIDRTRQYGEKLSVFLSALIFGLMHQNLFQFFYAFGSGLLFGYIYLRTGRLRYPVLLHGIINFVGAVIAPAILSMLDMEKLESIATMDPSATEEIFAILAESLPGLLLLMAYTLAQWGLSIAGLVLLILKYKQITWNNAETDLPRERRFSAAYLNVGMVIYILLCCAMTVLSFIPAQPA